MGIAAFSGTKPEPRPGSTLQPLQRRELAMKLMTATKRADPMIDQRMGKLLPPTLTVKSSGKPSRRASHSPTSADEAQGDGDQATTAGHTRDGLTEGTAHSGDQEQED